MLILPDNLSFDKAAFCEPLANVVHGVERTEIKQGQTVGIIGIGPIGLMFARLAKLKGARVIVAGRNPIKLKAAEEFAHADEIIDLTRYQNPEKIFREYTDEHKGLDVAVECVGLLMLTGISPSEGCSVLDSFSYFSGKNHYVYVTYLREC